MGASPNRTEAPSPHVAADEAAVTPAGSGAPVRAGTVSPAP